MKDQIGSLIKEAKDIIQSELNSTTPEYMALDRLCGAVELMHQRLQIYGTYRQDDPKAAIEKVLGHQDDSKAATAGGY